MSALPVALTVSKMEYMLLALKYVCAIAEAIYAAANNLFNSSDKSVRADQNICR